MIHTAEEIFNTYLGGNHNIATLKPIAFYEMIKIAQIEAIKECAETMYDYYDPMYGFDKDKFLKETIEKIK